MIKQLRQKTNDIFSYNSSIKSVEKISSTEITETFFINNFLSIGILVTKMDNSKSHLSIYIGKSKVNGLEEISITSESLDTIYRHNLCI